jgi:hypothetical protein
MNLKFMEDDQSEFSKEVKPSECKAKRKSKETQTTYLPPATSSLPQCDHQDRSVYCGMQFLHSSKLAAVPAADPMQAKSAAGLAPISMMAAPQDAVVPIKWKAHSVIDLSQLKLS